MVTETETTLRQSIVQWVDERIGKGDEQAVAFEGVAERIVREGHTDSFVADFAPGVVRDVYQSRIRSQRHAALNGRRRVDTDALKSDDSLMDTQWYVDGQIVRLGDFDKAKCQKAGAEFASQARGLLQDVNFLDRIRQNLKGKKTVSAVFTDDQLRSIWDTSRVTD